MPPMPPKKDERRLWVIILWAIGLLLGYFGSIALPWVMFIWGGPSFGLLTVIVVAVPWLAFVRYKPVGFNMAYFTLGMLLNVLIVFVSWFLHLF